MRNLLTEIIGARKKAFDDGTEGGYGDDLLGQMLMTASARHGAAKGAPFNFESVLDNTQMFYMAGQDTVAVVVAFSMLMLARHPEWQDRAHKEVNEVWASGKAIDASVLNRLKIVSSMQPHSFLKRTSYQYQHPSSCFALLGNDCTEIERYLLCCAGGNDNQRNPAAVRLAAQDTKSSGEGCAGERPVYSQGPDCRNSSAMHALRHRVLGRRRPQVQPREVRQGSSECQHPPTSIFAVLSWTPLLLRQQLRHDGNENYGGNDTPTISDTRLSPL